MDKCYERKMTVLEYITHTYKVKARKYIDERIEQYLKDIGLGSMNLNNFVVKFNLQDSSFEEIFSFVLSQKGNEEILSYYSQIIYSDIPDRPETSKETYDYGQGKFVRKF